MQTKATLVAVLVVVVAGALVSGSPLGTEVPRIQCPQEVSDLCPLTDGPIPEYFGHPDDCSKFCECDDQIGYERSCQPGLVFDETINVCNWPNSVDCGSRPIP